MKKSLFSLAFMAAALCMTGCSSEQDEIMESQNEMQQVQFSIDVENALGTKSPDTRAISDGTGADKLVYAVFDTSGKKRITGIEKVEKTTTFPTTVTINLAKGQSYRVAFWAQDADCDAYTVDDNMNVSIDYTGASNDETRDAFYAYASVNTAQTAVSVTLKRAFAQLNLATTKEDYEAAKTAGVDFSKSSIVIGKAANKLEVTTGHVSGETEVSYSLADMPTEDLTVNGKAYKYLAMGYFLVNTQSKLGLDRAVLEKASFELKNADESKSLSITEGLNNIPVQRNFRTNILGNSILTGNIDFNISIDGNYDGEQAVTIVSNESQLKAALNAGGYVKLDKNITLASTLPFYIKSGVDVVLDLNGKTITNAKDIWDATFFENYALIDVRGGNLTIEGNGKVIAKENDCFAVNVTKGGQVLIKDGTFSGNISAVQAAEGKVIIEGGEFSIQQLDNSNTPYCYTLNCIDANYKDGTASFVVKGGKFLGFNPGDNLAEGAGTSFLAEGFKAEAEGEYYVVSAE